MNAKESQDSELLFNEVTSEILNYYLPNGHKVVFVFLY